MRKVKLIIPLLLMLFVSIGNVWGADVTFNPASDQSFPKDGITISVTDGTLTNGTDYRVYKNQTMTISSTVGNITNIALTYKSASYDGGGWAASYQPNSTSWTSPTASGEQARITKIVVTVASSTYTVNYSNGGHGTAPSQQTEQTSVTLQALVADGWNHTGWKADQEVKVGGVSKSAGTLLGKTDNCTLTANTTFTAQWEAVVVPAGTIEFSAASLSKTVEVNDAGSFAAVTVTGNNLIASNTTMYSIEDVSDDDVFYISNPPEQYTYHAGTTLSQSITVEYLAYDPGTYTAKLYAREYDKSSNVIAEAFIPITLTVQAAVTPYKVTFSEGTGNTLNCGSCTDKAITGANITLPTATPCSKAAGEGWQFDGWSETSVAAASASYTKVANPYQPTQARTLYAVYKKNASTMTSVTIAQITSGSFPSAGQYIALSCQNNPNSTMSSADLTNGTGTVHYIGVTSGGSSFAGSALTTTDATVVFVLEDARNGYYYLKNLTNGKYVAATATANELVYSSTASDAAAWKPIAKNTKFLFQNKSYTTGYLNFASGASPVSWRCVRSDSEPSTANYLLDVYSAAPSSFTMGGTYQSELNCTSSWTVTYQGNGNNSGSAPVDANSPYDDGALVTVLGNTGNLAKTGYSFNGWKDDSEPTPFAAGDKFSIDRDYVMKAQWQAITYSVRYNKNNESATGSMANSSHTYGTAKNLTNNTFALAGHTFAGWTTNSDGTGTSYTNGQSVTNLASTQDAVVDLYAKWTIKTFTVTYDANTGTGSMTDANSPYNYNAEVTVKANEFTAPAGKKFTSWNTAANGSGTAYAAGANFNITANTTLYAQWSNVSYTDYITECSTEITLTYNMNGHGEQIAQVRPATALPNPLPVPAAVEGYTFGGWYTNEGLTIAAVAGTPITENTTLYAKWTINSHTLTWDFAGGETTSGEGEYTHGTVEYNAPIVAPADPTKDGFRFTSWNTTPASNMPDADVTYTAQWEAIVYDHFYVNGAEVDALKTEHVGGKVTFPVGTPENCDEENYPYFVGWAATDFGTTTTAPTLIEDGASREAGNYYAVFAAGEAGGALFTETFNTNDGTGGNDGSWSGSIASAEIKSDNANWTFVKGNGAKTCAKFGTGSALGSAQTPAIEMTSGTLTFKAAAWNGSSESTTLKLSLTSGTLKDGEGTEVSSVTLTKGAWTDYTLYISGVTTSTKIKFEGNAASNSRFFLDEVVVSGGTNYTEWITRCCEQPGTALSISGEATVAYNTDLALTSAGGNGGTVNWSVEPSANTTITATGASTTFRATKKGTYTITASQEKNGSVCATEAQKTVTVTAPLTSITVSGQTTTFYVSQSFSFDGTCTAHYADGSEATVTPTNAVVDVATPFASTGAATATVTYTEDGETKTAEYDITIAAAPTWTITLNTGSGSLASGTSEIVVLQSSPATTLPSCTQSCTNGGTWAFAGWSETKVGETTTTAPTFVATAANLSYTATKDVTLYAVYSYVGAGGAGETKTSQFKINTTSTHPQDENATWTGSQMNYATSNYGFKNDATLQFVIPENGTITKVQIANLSNNNWASGVTLTLQYNNGTQWNNIGGVAVGTYTLTSYQAYDSFKGYKTFRLLRSGGNSGTIAYVSAVTVTYTTPGTITYYNSIPCGEKYDVTLVPGAGNKVTIDAVEHDEYTYENLANNAHITLPAEAAMVYDNSEWSFIGWTAQANYGEAEQSTTRPALVNNDYTVTGDVTLYAVYEQIPPDDTFDGTASVDDVKMFMKKGTAYRYAVNNLGRTTGHFSTTTDCQTNASTFDLEKQSDGVFAIHPHGDATQYLAPTGDNNLFWSTTATYWSFATGTINGAWRVTNTRGHVLSGRWESEFGNYGDQIANSPSLYFELNFGECQEPIYTNNPSCSAQIYIRPTDATANGLVTSTYGKSTIAPGTYTVSAVGLKAGQKVWIRGEKLDFFNADGNVIGSSETNGRVVGTTDANGVLAATVVRISYAPSAVATDYETESLSLTLTSKNPDNSDYTKPFLNILTGRNLPAKFVVAEKVDGVWYALPNNMTSSATRPAAVKITVDEETQKATVRGVTENDFGWTMTMTTQAAQKHTIELVSAADSKYLTSAAAEANTLSQGGAQSGTNQARTEFVPNTEDLLDYKIQRNGWERYLGLDGDKNWGLYSAQNTVRFFHYETVTPTTELTLDKNNGSADCYCTATYGSSTTECSNTTREGYTLDGYTITLDGNDYVFNSEGTMQANTAVTDAEGRWASVAEEMTLYAHWTPIVYNITYNLDGGANGDNPATYTIETADITLQDATGKTGYTFEGWYTESTFDNKVEGVAIATGSIGDKEFWAKWTRNQFTVTYHHGDGTTDSENVNEGETPAGVAAKVCSENRVFVGWSTEPVAMTQTAPATVDPTTVAITGAKDYYAVYKSRNGGKAGAERLTPSNVYNTIQSNHATTAANFEFGESSYSAASGTEGWMSLDFKNQTNHLTTKNKINDLSAIEVTWRANGANANNVEIRISEDAENWTTIQTVSSVGTGSSVNPKFDLPYVGDYYVEIFVPSRSNTTDKLLFSNVSFYSKPRTFYYTDYATSCDMAASATMTFAGGATNTAHVASPVGETYILPEGTADGKQFRSWTCSGDGLTYKAGESFVLSHDVTMTAVWDPTLTWYNEQTDANHAVTYAPEDVVVMPTVADPTPCNSILEFVGWGDQIATTKTVEPAMVKASDAAAADKTYYAIFKHKSKAIWVTKCPDWYVVTYHANGGTGDDIVIDSDTRTLTTQAADVFTKDGHQIVAWSTVADLSSSDETATLYKPATSVTLPTEPKNVDLYAVWMGEMQISSASPISLTSYKGVPVYTTDNPENRITVSNTDMGVAKKIRFKYLANGETVAENNSLFRVCDASSYSLLASNPTVSAGAYNQKFALRYQPTEFDQKDTYTIRVEATNGNGQFVYASADLVVNGRSLPEKFVVAMKNPNDGLWYALKNVLGTTSAGATPAPEMITVDDNTNPTTATLAPASTFYKGATRQTAGEHRGGLRLQGFNNGNLYLTATKTNNATLYTKSGNDDDQQFYLQSSNLSTYNVTLDPTAYNDYSPKRYISMNGGTIGWFATSAKDVYFLPVAAEMTPAELQVVEWKTDAVVVMYTGAATSATTTVGAGAASADQTLATAKVDYCVYELTTSDMTSAVGQLLTVTFNNGGTKLIKMPLIVSGETTASVGTAGNDVVVLKGATFSAESTARRYPNITVYGGGKLVVGSGKKLEFSNLYLRMGGVVDGNYDYVYPQVVLNGQLNSSLNSQLYIDYVTTKDQYYTFVAPFAIRQSAIQYPQDIYGSNVTATNTGSFEFQYYDGEARATGATGWVVLPEDQDIVPGKGYTFLGMPKKINGTRQKFGLHRMHMPVVTATALTHETSDQPIAVSAYDADRDNDANWNLIGNPYMTTVTGLTNSSIKVGKLVHTMVDDKWTGGWHWDDAAPNDQRFLVIPSNDGQSYETVQASSAELPAFKNFFVQIAEGEDLVIPVERRGGRSQMPELLASQEEEREIEIPLYMQDSELSDELTFLVKSDYNAEFEFNADMYKMLNNKDTRVNLYGLMGDKELSFEAVNADILSASVPVGFSVPNSGNFTIGIREDGQDEEIQHFLLTDHEEDITTDLMDNNYTFSVNQKQTNNTRFSVRMVLAPKTPTGVVELSNGAEHQDGVKKVIMDQKLFIIVNGMIYDATGKAVK